MSHFIAPFAFVAALVFAPHTAVPAAAAAPMAVASHASTIEIYQLAVRDTERNGASQKVTLIIHADEKGFSGYALTDTHSVELDSVSIQGDILRAIVHTTGGEGELTLRTSPDGVQGTLTVRGRKLRVSGERTV